MLCRCLNICVYAICVWKYINLYIKNKINLILYIKQGLDGESRGGGKDTIIIYRNKRNDLKKPK